MRTTTRWTLTLVAFLLLPGVLLSQNGANRYADPDGLIPPGRDCLTSVPRGTQVSFREDPLPADFFFPGSPPFDGEFCVQGAKESDGTDICLERLDSMELPGPGSKARSRLVVRELRMAGCEPLVIRRGEYEERWAVQVGLSEVATSPGWIELTKTHRNGGTLTAAFGVRPRFVFTRLGSGPSEVRELDTGREGQGPFEVVDGNRKPVSWVHQLNPDSKPFRLVDPADPTGEKNFVPGVFENLTTGDQTRQETSWPCPPKFVPHNFTDRLDELANDAP